MDDDTSEVTARNAEALSKMAIDLNVTVRDSYQALLKAATKFAHDNSQDWSTIIEYLCRGTAQILATTLVNVQLQTGKADDMLEHILKDAAFRINDHVTNTGNTTVGAIMHPDTATGEVEMQTMSIELQGPPAGTA